MNPQKSSDTKKVVLGIAAGATAFVLLFVMWVYPEVPTASYALASLLAVLLGAVAWLNQKDLREAARGRTLRYGSNAALTVALVVAILTVVNYLNYNHFARKDLTKNKVHSLSEQTINMLKGLTQEVKLTVYTKTGERDAMRPLIDNYRYYTRKITVDWVDPDRNKARATEANVKKYGTIIVQSGKRDTRLEELNEEKLTNAFLKVLKGEAITVCFVTGHGEHTPDNAQDPNGFSTVKRDLGSQNYDTKTLNFLENPEIPKECSVIAILGPTKAFFEKEIQSIRGWLDKGGRAIVAIDPNLKGKEPLTKDLVALLSEWYINVPNNLIFDPTSRAAQMSEEVPLIAIYSKEHPITKDFQLASLFPLTSTVELKSGAPSSLKTWWLAKSTPNAYAKTDFQKILAGGKRVKDPKDVPGPHSVMVAVEGSRNASIKPEKPSRIIVMGSSLVASNQMARFSGNGDLFLNAVSWLAGDESLISIRPKDESNEKPTLSEVELAYSKFLSKFAIPFGTIFAGLVVWRRRKKL
jgi:ABC-type uncharacterized transport system involved in gliding motility auxiliary subunit